MRVFDLLLGSQTFACLPPLFPAMRCLTATTMATATLASVNLATPGTDLIAQVREAESKRKTQIATEVLKVLISCTTVLSLVKH